MPGPREKILRVGRNGTSANTPLRINLSTRLLLAASNSQVILGLACVRCRRQSKKRCVVDLSTRRLLIIPQDNSEIKQMSRWSVVGRLTATGTQRRHGNGRLRTCCVAGHRHQYSGGPGLGRSRLLTVNWLTAAQPCRCRTFGGYVMLQLLLVVVVASVSVMRQMSGLAS